MVLLHYQSTKNFNFSVKRRPAKRTRVPHISLVFREMWDSAAPNRQPSAAKQTTRKEYGCPTFHGFPIRSPIHGRLCGFLRRNEVFPAPNNRLWLRTGAPRSPQRIRISCYAAVDTAACAAFIKESRMKFVNAYVGLKSGAKPHHRALVVSIRPHKKRQGRESPGPALTRNNRRLTLQP
jgi:hypothetical protein